jgi:L-ascorbate metabolism protein UlaG (beta-lactamase superfamily)
MRITLVRHATLLLETSLGRVLVDPMLRAAGSTPPIENTPNQLRNPLVELPVRAEDIVAGVDLCIVTHLHSDHFDDAADAVLPRDIPIVTQPESRDELTGRGFTNVATEHERITMTRGRHGTGAIGEAMGSVSGWLLDDVYIAGDTIWCEAVEEVLRHHRPRVVIVNAGGARFNEGDPIVMDVDGVRRVREATDAAVVAVHLEAINHCLEPRDAYRAIEGVLVPGDGETLERF